MPDIIQNLKRAMQNQGVTNAELARRMDVHPQAVSRWLNAHVSPSKDVLESMAEALGCEWVLNDVPESEM